MTKRQHADVTEPRGCEPATRVHDETGNRPITFLVLTERPNLAFQEEQCQH